MSIYLDLVICPNSIKLSTDVPLVTLQVAVKLACLPDAILLSDELQSVPLKLKQSWEVAQVRAVRRRHVRLLGLRQCRRHGEQCHPRRPRQGTQLPTKNEVSPIAGNGQRIFQSQRAAKGGFVRISGGALRVVARWGAPVLHSIFEEDYVGRLVVMSSCAVQEWQEVILQMTGIVVSLKAVIPQAYIHQHEGTSGFILNHTTNIKIKLESGRTCIDQDGASFTSMSAVASLLTYFHLPSS